MVMLDYAEAECLKALRTEEVIKLVMFEILWDAEKH